MTKKVDLWTKEKIISNQQVLRQLIYKDFDKMRECAKTHKETAEPETQSDQTV
jgi:hypothetical protein